MFAYKGTFNAATSTGNQTITGIVDESGNSFTPKAILVWTSYTSASGFADGWTFQIGMSDGTTTGSAQSQADDNVAAQLSRARRSGTALVDIVNGAGTVIRAGNLSSFGSGQFVINWTTVPVTSELFHFLALGGTDLNALAVLGRMDQVKTTADSSVTSLKAILSVGAYTSGIGECGTSLGWVVLNNGIPQSQGVSHSQIRNNVNPSQTRRFQRTARFRYRLTATLGAAIEAFMDQSGVSYISQSVDSAAFSHELRLGGIAAASGSGLQPTSTGTQAVTGLGFSPKCVIITSVGQTAQTTTQNEARLCIGAADRTRQGYAIAGSNNGVTPSISVGKYDTAKIVAAITPNATATSTTTEAEASIQSIDSDGFTLNWTTADATQREYLWFALGDAPSADRSATFFGFV